MILGELADYYELLLDKGKVGKEGWENQRVSYVITIDYSGQVKSIFSMLLFILCLFPFAAAKKELLFSLSEYYNIVL